MEMQMRFSESLTFLKSNFTNDKCLSYPLNYILYVGLKGLANEYLMELVSHTLYIILPEQVEILF